MVKKPEDKFRRKVWRRLTGHAPLSKPEMLRKKNEAKAHRH
jgi:hypothetical protein